MSTPANHRFKQVRQALQQTIRRYTPAVQQHPAEEQALRYQATVKDGLKTLTALEARLSKPVLRVALFGLVSRGKSAVINALIGEPLLATGPLHGVTRWPRSVYWRPPIETVHDADDLPSIEFIDTPGLDEVGGEVRSDMAQEVAYQADLILFVTAGDITRTEYEALTMLQAAQKPILLVFNKVDLYPDADRHTVFQALTALWQAAADGRPSVTLAVDDVVMVAAQPAPLQVRVEWPDGRITYEWETPPPDIGPLKQALLKIARQDGATLIALNALREADGLETDIARRSLDLHKAEAEELIWKFAKYKALAVALNPIAILDLAGGFITDLAMIRALAQLYGLPITRHEARKLWYAIAKSTGALTLSEIGGGLLWGTGKGAAAAWSLLDGAAGLSTLAGIMAAQAGAAGYGTYAIGKAAQVYLEQGCTWGPQGIKTVMQDVLSQIDSDSAIARLRQALETQLAPSPPRR